MALFVTATLSSVAAATTSTQILAANQGTRHGVLLFNDSTATLYLAYAPTSATNNYSVQIPPKVYWEMPFASSYGGVLSGIWSAANGAVYCTELTE